MSAEGQLVQLDKARRALAKIARVDEAKEIRDRAEALRNYAKQQHIGLEAQNRAAEIKIRAERRAGELLAEVERQRGPTTKGKKETRQPDELKQPTYSETLEAAGIAEPTARRWQEQASIPEPVFDQFIETVKASGEELTSAATVRFARAFDESPSESPSDVARKSIPYRWEVETGKLERMVAFFEEHAGSATGKQRQSLEVVLADAIKRLQQLKRSIA